MHKHILSFSSGWHPLDERCSPPPPTSSNPSSLSLSCQTSKRRGCCLQKDSPRAQRGGGVGFTLFFGGGEKRTWLTLVPYSCISLLMCRARTGLHWLVPECSKESEEGGMLLPVAKLHIRSVWMCVCQLKRKRERVRDVALKRWCND